jgi:hypothetical protein
LFTNRGNWHWYPYSIPYNTTHCVHTGGPYGGHYAPYPSYGGYPPQQPQYYSPEASMYGGYNPYPMYQPMPPSNGPADGAMPPPPYPLQGSANSGMGGGEEMGPPGAAGYDEYHHGPPPPAPHPMGAGGPLPPMSSRGGHGESFPGGM